MALLPPEYLDCVVAIGTNDANGEKGWVATGFLYGLHTGNKSYRVFLVTNRHVLEKLSIIYLRFNPRADKPAREYDIPLKNTDGASIWTANPKSEVDVAVLPINILLLDKQGIKVRFFSSDGNAAVVDKMKEQTVREGDFVYALGFPMGLVGAKRNTVIVRSGSIAHIQDTLEKTNQTFLLDVFIFPGNSGGPVVLKPELVNIPGTKSSHTAYLIGIISSYVPYLDIAYSKQTDRPRVTFEENSGLAIAYTVDCIEETIREHLKSEEGQENDKGTSDSVG